MSQDGIERPSLTWLKNFVQNNSNPPNDFSFTNVISPFRIVRRCDLNCNTPVVKHAGVRFFDLQGRLSAYHPISGSESSSLNSVNQNVLFTLYSGTGLISKPVKSLKNK